MTINVRKKYNTIEYDHGIDFIRLSILSSVISHHEIGNFPSIKVNKKKKNIINKTGSVGEYGRS